MLSAPIVLAATVFKLKEFVFSIPFFYRNYYKLYSGVFVIKFLLDYLKKEVSKFLQFTVLYLE